MDNSAQEASAASAAVAAANSALEQTQRKLAATLDQKSYLEELKRKAEVKLHETTEKLEKTQAAHQALETEHRSQQEQLSILTLSVDVIGPFIIIIIIIIIILFLTFCTGAANRAPAGQAVAQARGR